MKCFPGQGNRFFALLLGIILCAIVASWTLRRHLHRETVTGCHAPCGFEAARLEDSASQVRNGVLQVLTNNGLLAASYPVPPPVSFVLPGSRDAGINPKAEVFNPAGGNVKAPPFQFLVTNGNRIDGAGSDAPDMLLVVPDIGEAVCRDAVRRNKGTNIPLVTTINLDPYPARPAAGQAAPLFGKLSDCVQYGGSYYFYYTLLEE